MMLIINKNQNQKMNFGPPYLLPPYFFMILYPTQSYIPSPNYAPDNLMPDDSNAETKSVFISAEDKIMVTKDDLLEEGYEQTKKAWTEEQDELLMKLCKNHQTRFEQIAVSFDGRNPKMCYSRYRRLTNKSKDCWTKAQNQKLKAFVEKQGQCWKTIQKHFPNRNYKQLKDHYQNYLRPDLKKGEWTVDDDLFLIQLINQHGKNWTLIEQRMPTRSRNEIKNRFFGRIRRINAKKMCCVKTEDLSYGNKLSLLPV